MKNIIITLITIAICTFAMCIVIFGRSPLPEKKTLYPPGSSATSSSKAADVKSEPKNTELKVTEPIVTTAIPDSAASEIIDITVVPEVLSAAHETHTRDAGIADASSDVTVSIESISKQSTRAATYSITDSTDEPDIIIEDELTESVSQNDELPQIYATAEHKNWRYEVRSFDISDALPDGITLSDTTQSFGYFDTYDENGFLVSRGDSVASHLSKSGEYDGYLGKEYVWAVLRFDLTNLGGKDEYINVSDLNLSYGEYKKVKYASKMRYRYSGSVPVGYMNQHDVMPEIPEYMQYYTLHMNADETKQLVFCYLIEKKYSDETFYLEMNIRNDGESYDWLKLN